MLDRSIHAAGKSDTKPRPFGAPLAARSYAVGYFDQDPGTLAVTSLGEITERPPEVSRRKVLVLEADGWTRPRAFHERAKSQSYATTFTFQTSAQLEDAGRCSYYDGGHPMSAPKWKMHLVASGGTLPFPASPPGSFVYFESFTLGSTPSEPFDYDDGVAVIPMYLVAPDPGYESVYPRYGFRLTRWCRRVFVYDTIVHDGETYDTDTLRTGWDWILRPRPNTYDGAHLRNADSRFEPFFYPAPGCSFLRWYARHRTGAAPDMDTDDSPETDPPSAGGPHVDIDAATFTGANGFDGFAIFAKLQREHGDAFLDRVPAGAPHCLILEGEAWDVTMWEQSTEGGEWVRYQHARPWGIYGKATVII